MEKDIMTSEADTAKESPFKRNNRARIGGLFTGTLLVAGYLAAQGFISGKADQERVDEDKERRDAMALIQAQEAESKTSRAKIAWAGGPRVVVGEGE